MGHGKLHFVRHLETSDLRDILAIPLEKLISRTDEPRVINAIIEARKRWGRNKKSDLIFWHWGMGLLENAPRRPKMGNVLEGTQELSKKQKY